MAIGSRCCLTAGKRKASGEARAPLWRQSDNPCNICAAAVCRVGAAFLEIRKNNTDVAKNWTPESWKQHEAKHLPVYDDAAALAATEATMGNFPPLVFAGEARALKASLAEAAGGREFLLQGGDCAESFAEFHPN